MSNEEFLQHIANQVYEYILEEIDHIDFSDYSGQLDTLLDEYTEQWAEDIRDMAESAIGEAIANRFL